MKVQGVNPTRPFPLPPESSFVVLPKGVRYVSFASAQGRPKPMPEVVNGCVVPKCAACGQSTMQEMTAEHFEAWKKMSRMCVRCVSAWRKLKDAEGRFLWQPDDPEINGLRYMVERVKEREVPNPSTEFPANKISGRKSDGLGHLFLGCFVVGLIVGIGIAMIGKM